MRREPSQRPIPYPTPTEPCRASGHKPSPCDENRPNARSRTPHPPNPAEHRDTNRRHATRTVPTPDPVPHTHRTLPSIGTQTVAMRREPSQRRARMHGCAVPPGARGRGPGHPVGAGRHHSRSRHRAVRFSGITRDPGTGRCGSPASLAIPAPGGAVLRRHSRSRHRAVRFSGITRDPGTGRCGSPAALRDPDPPGCSSSRAGVARVAGAQAVGARSAASSRRCSGPNPTSARYAGWSTRMRTGPSTKASRCDGVNTNFT